MFSVTFVIEENPVSWKRARQRGKQYFVDDKTRAWKDSVAQAFREAVGPMFPPLSGPVELALAFRLPMPSSWSKRRQAVFIGTPHAGKPDADNLAKAIMDALNGVAWHDDGQVARLGVAKAWAPAGAVVVEIREVVE